MLLHLVTLALMTGLTPTSLATFGTSSSSSPSSVLNEAAGAVGLLLRQCRSRGARNVSSDDRTLDTVLTCLQRSSLIALDRVANATSIGFLGGIELVRVRETTAAEVMDSGRLLPQNNSWLHQVSDRMRTIFKTHVVRMPMNNLVHFEGRRRKDNMMPLLLFGVMAMAIIAIPLGFQFLAVLGGKALLLAKLALVLSAIQGLKKIAVSDVHYGLYQSHPHSKPWSYDRRGQYPGSYPYGYDGYDGPDHPQDPSHYIGPRISPPVNQNGL